MYIHSKVWVDGSPRYGIDSKDSILKFIEKNISCSIPDPDKDPELYDLVMKYQVHKCTQSCIRVLKNKKKNKLVTICRYGFPREIQNTTTLVDIEKTYKCHNSWKKSAKFYKLGKNLHIFTTLKIVFLFLNKTFYL